MNPDALFHESLKQAGDPALAQSQWESLKPHLSPEARRTDCLRFFISLLGNTRFLIQRILHGPNPSAAIDGLVFSPHLLQPKDARQMREELSALFKKSRRDLPSAQGFLRAYKYEEVTRIAARDLSDQASLEEVGHELADLAEATTEAALLAAREIVQKTEKGHFQEPFVVLGLGKLGGLDLNFSSDIDILYVHGRPFEPKSASQNVFEHFCRVSETATRLLSDRTGDGLVFRVDLDLRPEGKSGVIVNSLEALTSYYEVSGAPWERGALTKARPVAGDAVFGHEVLSQLEPFVYPKHIDSSAIDDLKRMKAKINAELQKSQKSKPGGFHLKLGVGGIREIEFFVTAFQLIYGGQEPRLRERHTLTALRLLGEMGLAPPEDVERLCDAYIFLRRIENRIQMEDERQTHRLPTSVPELTSLARRMGFEEAALFENALKEKTGFVASCFERLAS